MSSLKFNIVHAVACAHNYEINVRLGHDKLRIHDMRNAIIKIIIIHVNYFLCEIAFKY